MNIKLSDLQIALLAAGMLLAANLFAMVLFVLFAKLPAGRFREVIRSIIYELDRFADSMSNLEKRQAAIQQLNDVLGWRRILVPAALIGWTIDMEVTAIRKMQAATNTPDLHVEGEENHAKGDTNGNSGDSFTEQK